MLTITTKQLQVFNDLASKKFEDQMVLHIRKFFAAYAAKYDENRLRNTIQYGHAKAKAYGFVSKRNICLYLNIMMTHGVNFDDDPRCNWAQEILADKKIYSSDYRIQALGKKSKGMFRNSAGDR